MRFAEEMQGRWEGDIGAVLCVAAFCHAEHARHTTGRALLGVESVKRMYETGMLVSEEWVSGNRDGNAS